MSDLLVVAYDDKYKAEEIRLTLLRLQKDYLIELEDAVVEVKDKEGKELSETLKPGSSALFVLVRKSTPDKVLDELRGDRRKGLANLHE